MSHPTSIRFPPFMAEEYWRLQKPNVELLRNAVVSGIAIGWFKAHEHMEQRDAIAQQIERAKREERERLNG